MKNKNKILALTLAGLMMMPMAEVFAEDGMNKKIDTVVEVTKGDKSYTDEDIADTRFKLSEARLKLNSDYRNLLKEEVMRENFIRDSKNYVNADKKLTEDYEKKLQDSKRLLNKKDASSNDLENALNMLRDSEIKLVKDYKSALKNEVKFAKVFVKTNSYKLADIEKSTNYDTALLVAKDTLKDVNSSEEDMKLDYLNLLDMRYAMDENFDFREALNEEVSREGKVLNSKEYKTREIEFRSDYKNSVKEAKRILGDKEASKDELDIALYNLKDARKFLGVSEKTLLKEEIEISKKIKSSNTFKNATVLDKKNFESALKEAEKVLKEYK
ncbi:hypothetical protein [Peptoniphilus sp.]|jgi:hypothetical protein|uniref:hypothetical protein n=1 Tax=Peptoniphilus sp. TaxID=1971214 RepID=UPI003D93A5C1